jgi:phage terminase small subunit
MNAIAPREDWGTLGPAMKALPNDRQRAFVEYYVLSTKPGYGAQVTAARRAGYGTPNSTPTIMANIAWRLMQDEQIQAAIIEASRKVLRGMAPGAVRAVHNLINDPAHKDHARALDMVLSRSDPITTHQVVDVTHRHVDAEQEALEELRALRTLGVSREIMIAQFGGNGLARLEAAEAADNVRRAQDAKVIEGEAVEIEPERQEGAHG